MKIALQTLTSGRRSESCSSALLLFLPAGTLNYWQAWVFMAVFIAATMIPSIYLAVKDPAALRRRMKAGPTAETRPVQRVAVITARSCRWSRSWSSAPSTTASVGRRCRPRSSSSAMSLVAVGLGLAQLVVIQNSYAAATITVEAEQKVVSTGLYGVVRHPMYVGALIMMVGTPLALDSYWGLVAIFPGLAVLALRIVDEENMLRQELTGYREYIEKVHYRLVPYVW